MGDGAITGEAAGGMSGEIRKLGRVGWRTDDEEPMKGCERRGKERKKRSVDPWGDFTWNNCVEIADKFEHHKEGEYHRNSETDRWSNVPIINLILHKFSRVTLCVITQWKRNTKFRRAVKRSSVKWKNWGKCLQADGKFNILVNFRSWTNSKKIFPFVQCLH